jgi:hypothetical protein
MLRTNSKKARENLRRYIMDNFDASNYTDNPPEDWPGIARFIMETYQAEKYYSREYMAKAHIPEINAFLDWCAGLPSVLDTCYYYNRSAVDDLGAILEETEEEKARFTDPDACKLLSSLIYMELQRGCK